MSHVPSSKDKKRSRGQEALTTAKATHTLLEKLCAQLCGEDGHAGAQAKIEKLEAELKKMHEERGRMEAENGNLRAENRRLQAMYSGAGSGAGGVGSTATANAAWSPGPVYGARERHGATTTMPRKRAQSEGQTAARMPPMKRAHVAGEVRVVFRCSAVPKASQKEVVQNQKHPKQGGGMVTLHLVQFEAVTEGVFPRFPEPYWIEIDTAELVRMGRSVRDRIPGSRGAEVCEAYKERLGGSIYYMNQKGGDRDYEEVMVEGIGNDGFVEAKKILQGGRKFSREMTNFYVDMGTQLPVRVN